MISRFISDLSDSIREQYPDHSNWICRGANEGRLVVSKPHWPEDQTIEIPVVGGASDLWGVGQQVWGQHENGHPQLPFARSPSSGAAAFGRGKIAKVTLYGDGQWVTPEADFINSCGLTVPAPQLVIRLDGLHPGTLTTLASFPRFSTGADPAGQWEDWIGSSDQLGLLAFTAPDGGGGSVTVLAAYSTEWFGSAYIGGYIGKIREYSVAGSISGISDRDIYFEGGQEHRGGREASRLAMGRRQGYFFVDLVNDPRGIYVLPLETGIYAFRRSDGAMRKTNWVQDVLNPTNSGSVSVYGKYVLGSGWAGYDKSESALEAFNSSLQGADPAAAYLADPTFGWLGQIKLPDDPTRGVLRLYTRISEDVDPGNYGLSYAYIDIDLKGRIPGKTTRRIFSNGIYFNVSRPLYQSDGNPLTAPGGGDLSIAARINSNLQSTRWPWLIYSNKIEVWISVCEQADGATSADPGQSYWSLYAIDAKAALPVPVVKNRLATTVNPSSPELYPGLISAIDAEFRASATASLAPYLPDPDYYPTQYFVRRSVVFTDLETGAHTNTDYYLTGYFYDGEDPSAPPDAWTEEDRFIGHPLPGDLSSQDYLLVSPSTDVGLDAILSGSGAMPTGSKDLDGNHYEAVSEPVHYTDGMELIFKSTTDTSAPFYPLDARLVKESIYYPETFVTSVLQLWAQIAVSRKTYSRGHVTWMTKTSADGSARSKVDISERFTWDNGPGDKATNFPLLGSIWQIEPVRDCLLVLRQCYWSITAGKPDLNKREPYLEIYSRSTMTRLQKISLHPPGDTGRALFCLYDLAPMMRVGVDAGGLAWAEIFTEWITASDYSASNRLELVQHLKTEISFGGSLTRTDHLWQGKKETGIPLPTEASNLIYVNNKAYWIESSNSVVQYANP